MKNKSCLVGTLLLPLIISIIFASCGKQVQQAIGEDALHITSNEESLFGCKERLLNVLSAVDFKVNTLLEAHNNEIKIANPDDYFLNEDYILSGFSPFNLNEFDVLNLFQETDSNEQAQTVFKSYSNGMQISYQCEKDNYELKFSSENSVITYSAQYSKRDDSFIFHKKEFDGENEKLIYFTEFIPYDNNAFFVQSNNARLYVKFEEDGSVRKFFVSQLKSSATNSLQKSLYPHSAVSNAYKWVVSGKTNKYEKIISFEDDILDYTDNTSQNSKQISINAHDYASAFLQK